MPEQDPHRRRGQFKRCLGTLIQLVTLALFWFGLLTYFMLAVSMGMGRRGLLLVRHEMRKRKTL